MENYSHPDIPEILKKDGNSVCVDCGSEKPNWASMNNGVFLCLKCAGIHRGFGMSISLIRSLQIDSWTENQLLYLTKGGNNNFKNNLSEFNIAETATLDIKYKSKAADYYRKFLKNEVDRECDSNYIPTQIVKPDMDVAMDIIEIKEDAKDDNQGKSEDKDKKIKKKFFGFMSNVLNKVKEGTTSTAKKVGKGITDLHIGDKLKVAGNKIAGAAKTSGHFIAEKTTKAAQNIAEKTKNAFKKGGKEGEKKEEASSNEDKKDEINNINQEGEKKEEKNEENKEVKEGDNNAESNKVPEEKVEPPSEEKKDEAPSGGA